MDLIVVLIILGALLIFLDFFIPTLGAMTAAALGMIVWALVLGFRVGPLTGWICLAATTALMTAVVLLGWRLAKHMSFIHTANVRNDEEPDELRRALVGRTLLVKAPLRPMGKVEADGRQFDARCDVTWVDVDAEVRVVEIRGRELVVRPADPDLRIHEGT